MRSTTQRQKRFCDSLQKVLGGMKGRILVVTCTVPAATDIAGGPSSGLGELAAVSMLMPLLYSLYDPGDIELRTESEVSVEECEDINLILLGGPETNGITREVLRQLGAGRDTSCFRDFVLVSKYTDTEYTSSPESAWGDDAGLCIKVRSPLNPSKLAFILAGVHTFGTHAAAVALGATPLLLAIAERFGADEFELIVNRSVAPRGAGESERDPQVTIVEPEGFEEAVALNPRDVTEALRMLPAVAARGGITHLVLGSAAVFLGLGLVVCGLFVRTDLYTVTGGLVFLIGLLHLWGTCERL